MAKRKSAGISMDPHFETQAKARAKALGFSTFSSYVNQLIRADLQHGGSLVVAVESPAPQPEPEVPKAVKKPKK
jgi:hypothetical protein